MLTLYEHPFALYCQKVLVARNEPCPCRHLFPLPWPANFDRYH